MTPFLSDIIVLIQAALDLMLVRPGLMKVWHLFMIGLTSDVVSVCLEILHWMLCDLPRFTRLFPQTLIAGSGHSHLTLHTEST